MKRGKRVLCSVLSLILLCVLVAPARAEAPEVEIVWLPEGVEPHDSSLWSSYNPRSTGVIGQYLPPAREVKKGDLIAVSRKGEYGYMDLNGELVIPLTDYSTYPLLKYFFFFSDGLLPILQRDDKDSLLGTHYMDKTGKTVLALDDGSLGFTFSDGVALVGRPDSWGERKWGAINTKGETVVPFEYAEPGNYCLGFTEGFAKLRKRNSDGRMEDFYVSADGKTEVPLADYDEVFWFSEGLAAVTKDGKRGFIDAKGNLKVPCVYDENGSAREFQNGFAVVCKDGKCGYINTAGEEIVPVEFRYVWSFDENGVAMVLSEDGTVNYIDNTGKRAEKGPALSEDGRTKLSDRGYEVCGTVEDGTWVTKDGKIGLVDQNGDFVLPAEYDHPNDYNSIFPAFHSGLALASKGGKFGYINKKGETVIPFESEENMRLGLIMGGYIGVVYQNGRYGIFENPYYEEPKAPSLLDNLLGGGKTSAGSSSTSGSSSAASGGGFPVLPVAGGAAAVATLGGGLALLKKEKRG